MKCLIIISFLLLSCVSTEKDSLKTVAINLEEASALEKAPGTNLYWVVEDSGNKSVVYGIDKKGNTKAQITVNVDNTDWESLASDKDGNLYIGDFGNNESNRKDLKIYKIDKKFIKDGSAEVSSITQFYYPEQEQFPPPKNNLVFDCEAFIEYKGYFYLFSKNRSKKSDGSFSVYKVPNQNGNFKAQLIGTLYTCNKKNCQVTGADISSDGKTIALLTADTVYLLTNFNENDFNNVTIQPLLLNHTSQKEGLCFEDDDTLMIVDERNKQGGGNMYEIKIANSKMQN